MKKFSFVFVMMVVVAFAASMASAQGMMENASFGIKGGLDLAKAYGDDVPDEATWKMGAYVGAFMNYRLNDMFVVQPEAFFAMRGWKFEEGDYSESWKLNYIDLDVLARLTVPMEGMVKPTVFVGPYVGFNISSDYKIEVGDESEEGSLEDAGINVKGVDFGFVVGGGVDFELSNGGMIILDIRYQMGLLNVLEADEEDENSEEPAVKNNTIIFMAGYGF